jgi:hypothetical protein
MTEGEWLECEDPGPMLAFLSGKASGRKLRLFACACCRLIWPLFPGGPRSWEAVSVSERLADGLASAADLTAARERSQGCEASACWPEAIRAAEGAAFSAAQEAHSLTISPVAGWRIFRTAGAGAAPIKYTVPAERLVEEQREGQARLMRDIFGPAPFRPLPQLNPAWLAWEGGTVAKLAASIYEERAFDRLPVLADALAEAGCDAAELLAHLRGLGPHVRGCWAVDLLLGKS